MNWIAANTVPKMPIHSAARAVLPVNSSTRCGSTGMISPNASTSISTTRKMKTSAALRRVTVGSLTGGPGQCGRALSANRPEGADGKAADQAVATAPAPLFLAAMRAQSGGCGTASLPSGACAQCFEDAQPGAAVRGLQAQSLLLVADRAARGGADHALHLADGVAARPQQGLQFTPLRAREARVLGRPGRRQAAAAAQPVGERGDCQGVALGGVVGIDRVVVAEHQERRSAAPGR